MSTLLAALAGALFALGLAVSGMTLPSKVLGFLDVSGAWDPTLMFVMGAALAVYAPAYWLITRRAAPLLSDSFHVPSSQTIDAKLVGGAATFGVGWGLSGFCPGPVLVALAAGVQPALIFGVAMLASMLAFDLTKRALSAAEAVPAQR